MHKPTKSNTFCYYYFEELLSFKSVKDKNNKCLSSPIPFINIIYLAPSLSS